ncbi:glycogen debranching protein GlgX [Galbitalea sp. SE-J8]|uniref:glycogen debranching protein GlgX n=1 Tax=Galbitalea sp. SE-J8 TaxID=3054952 RepID=UPI00338E392B
MSGPDVARLGVTLEAGGGVVRVFSAHATAMTLCVLDDRDPTWAVESVRMTRGAGSIWEGRSPRLAVGTRYALRAEGPAGPTHAFDAGLELLDPYARGLWPVDGGFVSTVIDDAFDWDGVEKPGVPLDHAVVYEAHVKGLTRRAPWLAPELRGTYAGLGHPGTIDYLRSLGVTSVELLPVHQSVSEQRLIAQGRLNYWGYNTLGFFAPHGAYATKAARNSGPGAVLREVKGMVKALHEAGLEVILDVVYNHTSEEGPTGPTSSLRGLDNASYYRVQPDGGYFDVTGCGNTLDASVPAVRELILDSLRYWATDVQIDGFRFDLMATLGRDAQAHFDPQHPLLIAIRDDPALAGLKLISEPWDVGPDGWQVGRFPDGYSEWNDGYRNRMRDFWLTDIGAARANGLAPNGIGPLARRLAGSAHVFSQYRGPMASVNFITAHDGFTMADLTAYYTKHNLGNGENNRDGTNDNHSFNHGVEGPTSDATINAHRHRAIRNLLGTLLLSAGIPMITAGDEFGRTQFGNNNAYCHDSELTWLDWDHVPWQRDLLEVTRTLTRLRRENPALRPVRYGRFGETVRSATQMDWYNKEGLSMTPEDWDSPAERTLQYLAASTPEFEDLNRILLVVHGLEQPVTVTLPEHEGVAAYTLLWDSARENLGDAVLEHGPGSELEVAPVSMQLFRAH